VAVKLEAFPFTDHGTVPGTLVQVSRDAVQDEKSCPEPVEGSASSTRRASASTTRRSPQAAAR
jgi:hypothetical protein